MEIKFLLTSEKNRSLEFDDEISRLCSNNETCWIHLSNGFLFSFDFDHESNPLEVDIDCAITQMSCTHSSLYYVTSNSQLIMITGNRRETIHNFPKHQKVKKMVSGVEHCLVMTSNGDVFSFGCGLRGALGHGDINSILSPMQVEGLAGLKIIDIAAGSFHSVAVSSFGDVYTWGWNTHGQLGLPKIAKHTFERTVKSHQQVFTTPQLIELEDEESVTSVSCGCKHTVLRSENNRVFSAGLNNYGQLGLATECEDVEKFTEVPVKIKDSTEVFCGHWSTYFIQ